MDLEAAARALTSPMRRGCASILLVLATMVPAGWAAEPGFQFHLVDTGEGQALVLDMGEREILIDGGETPDALRAYLAETGIIQPPIELVIVTHADIDAYNGLRWLFPARRDPSSPGPGVLEVWEPGDLAAEPSAGGAPARPACPPSKPYEAFMRAVAASPGVRLQRPLGTVHVPALTTGEARPFTIPSLPDVRFTVLSAGAQIPGTRSCSERRNNASVVLMLEVGGTRILVGGDAHGSDAQGRAVAVEAALLALEQKAPGTLKADILVAPRRGSTLASSTAYVAAVDPGTVLFGGSVRFVHPRAEVLQRYRRPGRRLLSTILHPEAGRDHIVCDGQAAGAPCRFGFGFGARVEWRGRTRTGEVLTERELQTTIQRIQRPTVRAGEDPAEALKRTVLDALAGADLSGASLPRRALAGLNLGQAQLRSANLTGAELVETDLRGADLTDAVLAGANLQGARADGASFRGAELAGARLVDTSMDQVTLDGADLTGAVFEPNNLSLVNRRALRHATYLPSLTYENSPHALMELRKDLKDAGLRDAEREVTYLIERRRSTGSRGERWLRYVAFDLTAEYGRRPAGPLLILAGLVAIFAVPYWAMIRWPLTAALYRLPPDSPSGLPGEITSPARVALRGWRAIAFACYFSLLSAVHIGWRDVNAGHWIARMQPTIYTAQATGWGRVVSGAQSLVSVYLIALSVLTYFGRPFD